jgi:Tfp pilus assembly protein PilO
MAMRGRASERTLLIVSISVFVVLIGTFSALSYRAKNEIERIEGETKVIERDIRQLQKKIDQLPDLEKERDRLAAVSKEAEKILPDAEEIEGLMTMLSEQAALSDCIISDFSLVPDTRGGGAMAARGAAAAAYKKVKFECTVSSNKLKKGYYCACKFLNLLERYERFIAADDFTVRAGTDAEVSMHLDLSAHTYTFTGTKATPGAAGGRRGAGRGVR